MLARGQRLTRHRDIARVVRAGRSLAGRTLVLHVLPTAAPQPRFAILVSSHVAKRAVDRNRVKRRIRAALAGLQSNLPPGLALLVRVRRAALSRTTAELTQEIRRTLTSHALLP
ncbi:MAG: ribonuclease P protein component [Candidatus Kerfeldbacteria bacterium]|nr:ribonuclease P protein component [Candidatus Kerfeldbacteria bacterium]